MAPGDTLGRGGRGDPRLQPSNGDLHDGAHGEGDLATVLTVRELRFQVLEELLRELFDGGWSDG